MNLPLIAMGITSILLQITVLRLLLSTFSGNELDIGITLSFWLTYVGLGSYTGSRINIKHAFSLSFILIALLALPTVFLIKAIRSVLSLEPGEAVSFTSTVISTAISLLPLCFVIGLQFPLAVSYSGSRDAAGKVYGLEALGAFMGGVLFTFLVSGRAGSVEVCLFLAFLNILTAAYISKKKIFILLVILPLSFYVGFREMMFSLPWQGMKPFQKAESKYGEISVIKIREQASIYVNGQLFFTYPDRPTEELKTHLPMGLHPYPSKILVIGGSPGTLKEFIKYPVERIDFLELDPKLIEVSMKLLSMQEDKDAVKDHRVRIIAEDGRRLIKRLKRPTYDIIILNLPQPSTASINRFYTTDFFQEAKGVLNKDGILAMTLPQSTGYIGRSMQIANGSVYNSLRSIFRYVEVTSQEYGGFFASDSKINIEPKNLEERFVHRGIYTKHFSQYIFRDAFSPFGVDYVRKRLSDIKFINTDLRPSSYLYNLVLWAEVHGGRIFRYLLEVKGWYIIFFLMFVLMSVSFLIFKKKRRVVFFCIFTTGFSGMSFMLAVILAYQASYGYVYETIGILAATFMIGLWTGAYLLKQTKKALKMLFYLELMTIALALTSFIFFKAEFLFYVLNFLLGVITGRQFNTANIFLGEPEIAGRLYGLDLIGSVFGAFIPAIILIPLFGIPNTLFLVAGIKVVSAAMILSLSHFFIRRG
jgi:spermidine synthase